MTLKQYQRLAKTIADKIENDLAGNVRTVRNIRSNSSTVIAVRDPKTSSLDMKSGESNAIIEFDTLSNPNNPNFKFRTLKPGSISAYNSATNTNVDLADYKFDSFQFKKLVDALKQDDWKII